MILAGLLSSPREIRQGEEIAWYADGDTIVRNEHNPSIAYAYGLSSYFDDYFFPSFLVFAFNCKLTGLVEVAFD